MSAMPSDPPALLSPSSFDATEQYLTSVAPPPLSPPHVVGRGASAQSSPSFRNVSRDASRQPAQLSEEVGLSSRSAVAAVGPLAREMVSAEPHSVSPLLANIAAGSPALSEPGLVKEQKPTQRHGVAFKLPTSNSPKGSTSPRRPPALATTGAVSADSGLAIRPPSSAAVISDDALYQIYSDFLSEDGGVSREAISAAREEAEKAPLSDAYPETDRTLMEEANASEGLVARRAPLNPFASKRLGKFRMKKQQTTKVADPALRDNPLRGKLIVTIMTTTALLFVFCQSLVANKLKHGSFHTTYAKNGMVGPESDILVAHGGLNADLIRNQKQIVRLFWAMWMHSGWLHILFNVLCQLQFLFMFEPDWGFWKVFIIFWVSGVSGNLLSVIANPCSVTVGSSGALFGLMGAMVPYCIEFWRSIPRPGCILAFSIIVLLISVLTGFTKGTDNWAHIGGLIGGLLFAFATISTLSACRDFGRRRSSIASKDIAALQGGQAAELLRRKSARSSKRETKSGSLLNSTTTLGTGSASVVNGESLVKKGEELGGFSAVIIAPDGRAKKKVVRSNAVTRQLQQKMAPSCRCGKREWIVRLFSGALLVAFWIACFTFLFVKYEYKPLGQVTYNGVLQCCCCYSPTIPDKWTCQFCDNKVNGLPWSSHCAASNLSRKARSAFAHMPLDELVNELFLQGPVDRLLEYDGDLEALSASGATLNLDHDLPFVAANSSEENASKVGQHSSEDVRAGGAAFRNAMLRNNSELQQRNKTLAGSETERKFAEAGDDKLYINMSRFPVLQTMFEEPLSKTEWDWIRNWKVTKSQRNNFFREMLSHFMEDGGLPQDSEVYD